jgi:uncharacterized membrane protein HdeD (DUF308 family)
METGRATLDPALSKALARRWRAVMAVGLAAIFLGCLAILVPAVASVGTAIFVGWLLIAASAALTAAALTAHSIGTVATRLLWALLTFLAGFWLVIEPNHGTWTLTVVLGIYFLVMGASRLGVAFASRGRQNAGLLGLSGLASLLVGILILAELPSSADWAIGLLVGVDLIFAGWALASVALLGKDLSRAR